MKAFIAALAAMVVIGTASWAVLNGSMQQYSEQRFTTSSVRLPQH